MCRNKRHIEVKKLLEEKSTEVKRMINEKAIQKQNIKTKQKRELIAVNKALEIKKN